MTAPVNLWCIRLMLLLGVNRLHGVLVIGIVARLVLIRGPFGRHRLYRSRLIFPMLN